MWTMTMMTTRTTTNRASRQAAEERPRSRLPPRIDLLPHRPDGSRVVSAAEDGRSRNERIGAGLGDGRGVIDLDPAIDLQPDVAAAGIDSGARFGELRQRLGNEFLSAEPGVDRHQQHQVDLVDDVVQPAERSCRIEYQPGLATRIPD